MTAVYLSVGRYLFTADPAPAAGAFTILPSAPSGTSLVLSTTQEDGTDTAPILAAVAPDDVVRVKQVSGSTEWDYTITAAPTLTGDVWTVPVVVRAGGGGVVPGKSFDVGFLTEQAPADAWPQVPATIEDAHNVWADSRDISDDVLSDLLALSWSRLEQFTPAEQVAAWEADPSTFPGPVLLRWRHANVIDARDAWRAAQRDGDVVSFDTYAMRLRPVSDTVRSLLRPRRGRPQVG